MISLDDVRKRRKELFDRSMELVEKKGRDYNREQQQKGDTLHNLRICAMSGVVRSPQKGVLVRLSDKLQRLNSLENPSEVPANKDESVIDTVADVHNYIDYFLMFYEEERKKNDDLLKELEAWGKTLNAEASEKFDNDEPKSIYRFDTINT